MAIFLWGTWFTSLHMKLLWRIIHCGQFYNVSIQSYAKNSLATNYQQCITHLTCQWAAPYPLLPGQLTSTDIYSQLMPNNSNDSRPKHTLDYKTKYAENMVIFSHTQPSIRVDSSIILTTQFLDYKGTFNDLGHFFYCRSGKKCPQHIFRMWKFKINTYSFFLFLCIFYNSYDIMTKDLGMSCDEHSH